ncbi:hypothetical protein CJU94_39365 (plasmid) [Paraburkholderia aromaticivorans]|uniref:Uncharacterized protein n=1 Tax=Paraburkholderia aromaticivorans TaxID=2026199 RepID=A0A248VZ36_9BURK|nr:hypothetical protein CJU94_39365 [Paraburkholderia aromaticivorans]
MHRCNIASTLSRQQAEPTYSFGGQAYEGDQFQGASNAPLVVPLDQAGVLQNRECAIDSRFVDA